MAVVAVLVGI
jgi:hypothetical protein